MAVALVDLHAATGVAAYRGLAERVADNSVARRLREGNFMPPGHNGSANIDALALYSRLHFEAPVGGLLDRVPVYVGSAGFIQGDYLGADGTRRGIVEGSLY